MTFDVLLEKVRGIAAKADVSDKDFLEGTVRLLAETHGGGVHFAVFFAVRISRRGQQHQAAEHGEQKHSFAAFHGYIGPPQGRTKER